MHYDYDTIRYAILDITNMTVEYVMDGVNYMTEEKDLLGVI